MARLSMLIFETIGDSTLTSCKQSLTEIKITLRKRLFERTELFAMERKNCCLYKQD